MTQPTRPNFTELLTDYEIEYLCKVITPQGIRNYFQKDPKTFAKLKPGFRAISLTDQQVIDLMAKNRNKNFCSELLNRFIKSHQKEVHDRIDFLKKNGTSSEAALIQALASSDVFSDYVELYFKLEDDIFSEEHVSLVKAAVSLLRKKEIKSIADSSLDHELSEAMIKIEQMQAELDQFYQREKYADIPQGNEVYQAYQHTSLCQVIRNDLTEQVQLKRLADIHHDDQLTPFQLDETIPYRFENRDMLFKIDGPSDIGFFGIWHWNAIPNRNDPERDFIDSAFDSKIKPIEILVLPDCTEQRDIVEQLSKGIPWDNLGEKMLLSMRPVNEQYSGLLCDINDFDIQYEYGVSRIKKSVFTRPLFCVHIQNTLTLNGRRFCRNLNLGLPLEIVNIRDPLDLIKEIIRSKLSKVDILQQQGLSINEARRYRSYLWSFLESLETSTLYDEIAESYDCSVENAKKYVTDFVEQAEKFLNGSDINTGILSTVIQRDGELMSKCKDMIFEEWSIENEEQLRTAQQTLEELEKATKQQRQSVSELEAKRDDLQHQIETIQAEIDKKEAFAITVEENVSSRITEARKNAADFISELAFTVPMPVVAQDSGNHKNAISVFVRPIHADRISGTIIDLSDFEDSLAENLENCGYSEDRSEILSQILSFCVGQHMPIICDSNVEIIADCLAAMFGLNGVTVVHMSTEGSFCCELCDLFRQKRDAASPQVYLINGALDAYSPNTFNGILQSAYDLDSCILIFSSEGTPSEALPPSVWGRAMFIDGDIGLVHLSKDHLNAFETEFDFQKEFEFSPDKLKEMRKQLKPFTQIISNRALLNYACFMAVTNSSIQSDTCILTQILLNAKANGKLENLLELFEECEIDIKKSEVSKYLRGVV